MVYIRTSDVQLPIFICFFLNIIFTSVTLLKTRTESLVRPLRLLVLRINTAFKSCLDRRGKKINRDWFATISSHASVMVPNSSHLFDIYRYFLRYFSKGHYHKYSHEVLSVYTNNSPKTPKSLSARKTNLLHFVFKHVEMFIHYTDIV